MNAVNPRAVPGAVPTPRPAAVRYNDWPAIPLPDAGAFTPERPVSAIVPAYGAPGALALTLAGLERQDWPPELLEVVVVDDGSEPPLAPRAGTPLDVRVVRQPRRGFGLARARNNGVRAASHDILVFLDADVIAAPGLIRAHARWHHEVRDALTVGFCAYVSAAGLTAGAVRRRPLAELLDGRAFDAPWLERHMARTADFTSRHTDLFRAVTGHNFGIARALFEEAGGFDETFTRYGGEDTEFAYRAQVRGALLVPVRAAFGWHQGRWSEGREHKERDMRRQADKLADLIPEPGFRQKSQGRRFSVPRYVVTLVAGQEPVERVVRSADALLAAPGGDLALRIDIAPSRDADRVRLWRRYGNDARVQVGLEGTALDAFPASPLHILLPACAPVGPDTPARLDSALGDAATASASLHDTDARVTITRAWALNRARRAGGKVADYGHARIAAARVLGAGPVASLAFKAIARCKAPGGEQAPGRERAPGREQGSRGQRPAAKGPRLAAREARAVIGRVWAEARHVRGARTGWRFLRWFVLGVRWRLRQQGGWSPTPPPERRSGPTATPDPPLGVVLAALGPRARAVFAASSRVRHGPGNGSADVTLADTARAAEGVSTPRAVLEEAPALAVPAFDPALHNPIGWVRHVEGRAVSLGPPRHLPRGSAAQRAVTPDERDALLHCHHVEDVAVYHADPVARAGTLARIAALGVPVRIADRDPALKPLLGGELHGLMSAGVPDAGAAGREALSIAQRREALRTHSLAGRVRQVCEAAGAPPPPRPLISVLLATRRAPLLAHAVANVARQRYPNLQLVLALHGPGFEPHAVDAALGGFAHPVNVLRVDADRTLGAVLSAATAAASGALLAKMDDDDVYGPEHLWDLALAHGYSGCALVGKFFGTVYLARSDRTVRTREVPAETWSRSIAGGTMLIARGHLERAGGWRDVPRHVDAALIEDVLRIGAGVYRTHDAGYVLVRHHRGHTWESGEEAFLATAEAVQPGWRPALAGIGDAPRPPGAGDAIAAPGAGRARAAAASRREAPSGDVPPRPAHGNC